MGVPLELVPQQSLIPHLALADDTFYYREAVSTQIGSGSVGDVISSGKAIPVNRRPDVGSIETQIFQTIRSSIDSASDVDIFRISGTSATLSLELEVVGADGVAGTLADPQVRVLRISGNNFVVEQVDDNSGPGRGSFTEFELPAFSDRFIEVSSADGGIGSYRLQIDDDIPRI